MLNKKKKIKVGFSHNECSFVMHPNKSEEVSPFKPAKSVQDVNVNQLE